MSKHRSPPRTRTNNHKMQLGLQFSAGTWGGARAGAGRPRGSRRYIPHQSRPSLSRHKPLHITLRVKPDVPSLRNRRFGQAFRRTLAECCVRAGFRVVHYSIQTNHAHCIIEATDRRRLANGMKSFAARFARAVNRVFDRTGPVLAERFHLRVLNTPREVRHALAYVLLNARKHWFQKRPKQRAKRRPKSPQQHHQQAGPADARKKSRGLHTSDVRSSAPVGIDPMSSGRWFDGWSEPITAKRPIRLEGRQPEVAAAKRLLLARGWRRHRLIKVDEIPG